MFLSNRVFLCASALFFGMSFQSAQGQATAPDDELQGVIVLIRHGVRAPINTEIRDSFYNSQPWARWSVPEGVLSEHGTKAVQLLAEYYRSRYASLLQDKDCEHPGIYSETTTAQRTMATAKAMLPVLSKCKIEARQRKASDAYPLFSPVAGADRQRLRDATEGRIGAQWSWFINAFSDHLEDMHRVMTECGDAKDCDRSKPDFRTTIVKNGVASLRDPKTDNPVTLGSDFAEHFLLDYTEGLPMEQIGWGRVDRAHLNRLMQMNTLYHDFMARTPYVSQVNASNLALRLSDTLSAMAGKSTPGALGSANDHFVLLVAHDGNIADLGGLLRMEWLLPDQSFNATPPGGGYAFELHRNKTTGAQTVRVIFITQTLDQMRFLTPLLGDDLPSTAPIFIPGCSGQTRNYDCTLDNFRQMVNSIVLTTH